LPPEDALSLPRCQGENGRVSLTEGPETHSFLTPLAAGASALKPAPRSGLGVTHLTSQQQHLTLQAQPARPAVPDPDLALGDGLFQQAESLREASRVRVRVAEKAPEHRQESEHRCLADEGKALFEPWDGGLVIPLQEGWPGQTE
jgi:hypothetical protein